MVSSKKLDTKFGKVSTISRNLTSIIPSHNFRWLERKAFSHDIMSFYTLKYILLHFMKHVHFCKAKDNIYILKFHKNSKNVVPLEFNK